MKGLHDIGEVVIKPTVESGSGRGVRFVRLKNGVDVLKAKHWKKYSGSMARWILQFKNV